MQETSPVGNEPTTDSDNRAVETTGSTPTKALEPTKVPSQNTPAPDAPTPDAPAPSTPAPNVADPMQFPPRKSVGEGKRVDQV